jgi:hypothetical protein
MGVLKRLIIVLALAAAPLGLGLLFTYDIIKIDWVSFMEIQNSFSAARRGTKLPAASATVRKRTGADRSRPFWPINRSAFWKAGR